MPVTMRTWSSENDRIRGKDEFEKHIQRDHRELDLCKKDPAYARRKFAEWGQFYVEGEVPDPVLGFPAYDPTEDRVPIPMTTQFQIWSTDPKDVVERNDQVILIVDLGNGLENLGEHAQVWRCTYSPYGSHLTGQVTKSATAQASRKKKKAAKTRGKTGGKVVASSTAALKRTP